MQNCGYDGIALKQGEKYDLSLFARVAQGSKGGKLVVRLLDEKGNEAARTTVNVSSKDWKQLKAVLKVTADVRAGALSPEPQSAGAFTLAMVSLFPPNTFKERKKCLRADLE